MSPDKIKELIQATIPDSQVETSGADCNFSIVVTSSEFEGKSPIQRHRMVNDIFKTQFETGELHALSIKTEVK
ncbi:BolA/IbaG family iron-sulfur metabolism protein [Thiomicrorhabdus sp. ZW0627]|uniref:BolA family protein n=1 Tax=Thiomicrorhabdus sp. ZW0627 TaxID=3039774 RepID=UPI002436F058|nr:BolA/IbaG family iron-sulfur metabolism protein [Thiomicrorhabdus sp. ZW0627]MDG6773570.1 BolA/IbaG family iron-sulfur metabolism protein [Thiomicrorhabdus sp. ZW0627]